jgi:hypothetical protein
LLEDCVSFVPWTESLDELEEACWDPLLAAVLEL